MVSTTESGVIRVMQRWSMGQRRRSHGRHATDAVRTSTCSRLRSVFSRRVGPKNTIDGTSKATARWRAPASLATSRADRFRSAFAPPRSSRPAASTVAPAIAEATADVSGTSSGDPRRTTVAPARTAASPTRANDSAGQHFADPNPAPDRLLESRELGLAIRTVLSDLSPERRRAVQAHLMGYDVKEIMAMQGWPYNKARNLIARGMADLRRGLRRRGVGG